MKEKHSVAIIGGACSGSELVKLFNGNDVDTFVFEQSELPYGKVEDGLPLWHEKVQNQYRKKIDTNMLLPSNTYIPNTKVGQDISLKEMVDLKFSLIVLANGAGRDRTLELKNLEQITDDSFAYQNSFVYWFNHKDDNNYKGLEYKNLEGAVIIGGGLASIDMAKICQMESVINKMKERGINIDLHDIDKRGINAVLGDYDLSWDALGLKRAGLYYRRRERDMSLTVIPKDASDEKREKGYKIRDRMLRTAQEKFLFDVFPLMSPESVETKDGKLASVGFRKNSIDGSKITPTDEIVNVDTGLIISSVGSLPIPIDGIEMDGEIYAYENHDLGKLKGFENVFAVGNVVTGKGNLVASKKHSRFIGSLLVEHLNEPADGYDGVFDSQSEIVNEMSSLFLGHLKNIPTPNTEQLKAIKDRVSQLQSSAGYDNDYEKWKKNCMEARSK